MLVPPHTPEKMWPVFPRNENADNRHSLQELPIPGVQLLQLSFQLLLLSVFPEVVCSLFFPPLGIFHHFLAFTLQFLWRDLSRCVENTTTVNKTLLGHNPLFLYILYELNTPSFEGHNMAFPLVPNQQSLQVQV